MNKVMLMGRLTRDPEIRTAQNNDSMTLARFTLAVDRRFRRDGEATADFINCVAFGRNAEFAEKYLRKGIKVVIIGRIQTNSYTNREGKKVYMTDVIVDEQEFAESRTTIENNQSQNNARASQPRQSRPAPREEEEDFMNIPEGIDDNLPFN